MTSHEVDKFDHYLDEIDKKVSDRRRQDENNGQGGGGIKKSSRKKKKKVVKKKKKVIRKHKGINQKTGRLNKGYKYSKKKLKSGLKAIIKV